MKKMYVLLVALSILPLAIDVNAQGWCKPGSQWYYWSPSMESPMVRSISVTSYHDTIINERVCYKTDFRSLCQFGDYKYIYVHSRNDSVFFIDPILGDFKLLYDFTKKAGESYKIHPLYGDYKDYLTVTIDSVKTEVINGKTVRVQYAQTSSHSELHNPVNWNWILGSYSKSVKIIEYIGSITYFLPRESSWCDYILRDTLCSYEDPSGFFYKVGNRDCSKSYDSSVTIESIDVTDDLSLYPNPASNIINIKSPRDYDVSIFDIYGKQVGVLKIKADDVVEFNLSQYMSGTYFIKFQSNQKVVTKKVVKL